MTTIPLTEPVSPRYIHVNAATNCVHLLMPIVGGQEISTDNTCKSTKALQEFFAGDGGALSELNAYKDALKLDIQLLGDKSPERVLKEDRLTQIRAYINAFKDPRFNYSDAVNDLLKRPSNLHSIQLRPGVIDSASRVVNPTFTVDRRNNASGAPLSPLYNAMYDVFPVIKAALPDPRAGLITEVLSHLPPNPGFEDIQNGLSEQCQRLFGLTIDFTHQADSKVVDKDAIDSIMMWDDDASSEEYIDALLGLCAGSIWESIPTPPFYSIPAAISVENRTERLSILTQFFLANVNVYCKTRGMSTQNFGAILDTSPELSEELVNMVAKTIENGSEVEKNVIAFINEHKKIFGLSQPLTLVDNNAIKQKFERTYRTVTASDENPHMDDFMILDFNATAETAKFVTHQGSICVDFAEIVDPIAESANSEYFNNVRADFVTHTAEIPHRNESVAAVIDIDIETLMTSLNDEQFERLPQATKDACRENPGFQTFYFLSSVAKVTLDKTDQAQIKTVAEALLTATPTHTQTLLQTPGVFTDNSGRTFNCTAYEYTYWAKDTQMCRILEAHMDEETKAEMLNRITAIEENGLSFQQNGETHQSTHFDLTALKTALQKYIDGYTMWSRCRKWSAVGADWMAVGKAQRDVPVHIARSYNDNTSANDSWFAPNSGLGIDFAVTHSAPGKSGGALLMPVRGKGGVGPCGCLLPQARGDLAAIIRLDDETTNDITLSREHLSSMASTPSMCR